MRNCLFSLGAMLTGFSLFFGLGTANAQNYTAEEILEIQANQQIQAAMKISNPFEPMFNNFDYGTEGTMADWIPVAGATETFTPAVGDHFFDPGGPGGGADGSAGNYPNCNCDTKTTLSGVSQIKVVDMDIFANFDYLRIYDGTSTSGTLLYGNGAGDPDDGDYGLPAGTILNAASGNFYFFFHASSVVNRLGWDIEIMATDGGGGSDYCIPAGTNSNYYINDFFTTGADTNITNMGTGFSTGGYGDFYSTHGVSAAIGDSFDFTANFPTGQTYGFRIWVDWNQDGVFDTTEEVAYNSTSYQNPQTGTVTVPSTALTGDTRMRIVGHWLNNQGNIDPCSTTHNYGEFEDYKFTVTGGGGGGPFPDPYCNVYFPSSVEPISKVIFNTINNASDPAINGSPALEDFTSVTTSIEAGDTYPIAVEGNTNGAFTTYVTVYIDYDQSGTFEESERTNIGTIYNSSGTDGIQATGDIIVPSGATAGPTRMRVLKKWGGYVTDACNTTGYGQAEDYTVNIGGGGGTGDPCEIDFPHSNLDGTGNTQTLLFADDFQVATGVTMTVDQISVRMFNNIGQATKLAIYENAGGQPAASPLYTYSNVVPDSQTVIDNNYGMDIYDIVFTLPTTAELTEGTYWFAIQNTVGTDGGTNYWTITNSGIGSPGKYSTDGGVTWTTNSNGYNFSFTASGTCETSGGGGSGCLWTVHVFDTNFGDEVEWELRNSGGTALISGGFYGSNYDDIQTVTDEGPVTFWITNDGFFGDNTPSYEVSNEHGIIISGQLTSPTTETFADLKCSDGDGGGTDCDALFTANAATGGSNGFAGVTFDIANNTSEEMTITGFKVPVTTSNSSFDMDIYYTTTASTNVGVHQDPSEWTLLESKTNIPAISAVPFDPSTFSQVDLNNTLVLQPGQSKGIYVFVTDYSEGNTYRYSNGSFTETNGDLTILSNGFGSNDVVFSNSFADRAFVGEVQYCVGEGGGGTGSPCSQEYMTANDPVDSPNGAGITAGNRVANDVIVDANDSFTVQTVSVPILYVNGAPTTFNVQFYEDDGSSSGGIGAAVGPAISYATGDYTSTFQGNWAGVYPLYMIEFPIPDVQLDNTSSSDAHFWVVVDGDLSTTGDYGYIAEFPHDGNPSYHTLQYLASSSSWIIYNSPTDMEGYMIVDGICGDGGTGGACTSPVLEINQDIDDTCMANFSQGGLAQSYKPLDSSAAGAGIKLRESSTGLNVTLSLWDGLPNAGGAMLTTGTTQTTGDVWVDVFWDEIVNVTVGDTYYIVIEGDAGLPCIAGALGNPYPDGMVYANAYSPFPDFDYTFRTYSCNEPPTGGPCDDKIVMDCGVTYTATLTPASGEWVNYTGVSYNYTGSEQVFEFTAPTTDSYTFELDQGANDADFMVMDACSNTANNVLGSGYWTGLGNETITLTGGTTYYIIADLYEFAGGATTVSIKVNCPEPPIGDCNTESPSNGFENGGSFLKNMGRVAANDVIVPVNQQMLLQSITFNAFIGASGSGVNADNVDLFIYEDAGGQPGTELHAEIGIVPTSQTVIGSNFGYDIWEIEIDFPDYLLLGNTGSATNYWVGLSLEPTDGSNTFWEDSSAAIVNNYNMAYFDGSVWDMTTFAGLEGVYTFHAICSTLGVSDVTSDFDFAYYPNPVKDVLNITSQKAVKTVDAFNMAGQKVLSTNKVINGQIDVNALTPGVYVFKAVLEGGQVETFKIIKK